MGQMVSNMASAMHVDESAIASAFQFNMDEKELSELMTSLMSTTTSTYDSNLAKLGYAEPQQALGDRHLSQGLRDQAGRHLDSR